MANKKSPVSKKPVIDYQMDRWFFCRALWMEIANTGAKITATAALKTVAGIFVITFSKAASEVKPLRSIPL